MISRAADGSQTGLLLLINMVEIEYLPHFWHTCLDISILIPLNIKHFSMNEQTVVLIHVQCSPKI